MRFISMMIICIAIHLVSSSSIGSSSSKSNDSKSKSKSKTDSKKSKKDKVDAKVSKASAFDFDAGMLGAAVTAASVGLTALEFCSYADVYADNACDDFINGLEMPTYADNTYSCDEGCVIELISRNDSDEKGLGGLYEFSSYVHDN
jgi:hypothetical protein